MDATEGTAGPAAPPLRYHLRFQLVPNQHVRRDARALARFCTRHGIEEVALFLAVGDWCAGPLSAREQQLWYDALATAKAILEKAGITVSLNIWVTVGHCDAGRRLPRARGFQPMVSPTGRASQSCPSFADPAWQRYIGALYGRFARLGFRVIWIDDDFRYHNHPPLDWGGGFEPPVLARFAAKVGRAVSREELVENILRPGAPHPWRALWLATWREVLEAFARRLADAVAANTPCPTKLGLMSSHPTVHSIEGRDWPDLFDALSLDGQVAHRPHYALYRESLGSDRAYSMLMLDRQREFRPGACEVAPEIESYTYTHWAKSDSMTWADMALALLYGSDALLLEIFPICGNPVDEEDTGIGALLDVSRPALEWIAARFAKPMDTRGVGIPWRQDAAERTRTIRGQALPELAACFLDPAQFLVGFGVPCSARRQTTNAVFGSTAWAFDDDELREMLAGGLLLDAVSADILWQRGFGRHIGARVGKWLNRHQATYAMERVVASETGLRRGFDLTLLPLPSVAVLKPHGSGREWTHVVSYGGRRLGAGIVAHENALGGRVVTLAAPGPGGTYPTGLPRCDQRQILVHRVVDFLSRDRFASFTVSGGPHLLPMHFTHGDRQFAVVFNGSPDPALPVLCLNGITTRPREATLLPPLGLPAGAAVRTTRGAAGITVTARTPVPYLGFLVLEWGHQNPGGR